MGKKSGPSQPAAPDPVATAQAQSTMNKETAVAQANLNRIDQYTPQGSITYQQIGTNADGTPRYQQTQQYSPEQQKIYNQNNQVTTDLNDLALGNINRVAQTQGKDFNFDGMTPMQTSVGGNNPFNFMNGPTGSYGVQSTIGDTGQVQTLDPNAGGKIQTSLDYSKLTALPGTSDFSADAQRINDAVYNQATSRLDPAYQQQESDLRSRLAAQGISENSDAYRRELDNFNRAKTDAYNQATYSARQAGADEQSRLFGLALGARQQGQNEVNTAGNFANSAQAQGYSQASNTVGVNNQAQDQRYTQALGIADLFNQAQQQRYSQDQSAAAFNNQARAQAFNEDSANANLNNQARQQQINEATYLRNLPLNDIAALLGTGTGVMQPQFQDVSQVGVAAPDYTGLVQNNYNAQMQAYNQAQANRSAGLGSIFGAIGTGAGLAFSDRRIKTHIRRIGTLANGLATYAFRYVGSKAEQFGVMAQEVFKVLPEAVGRKDGVLYVDYSKVYA